MIPLTNNSSLLTFSAYGVPVPGGSKKAWFVHAAGCPAGKRYNAGPCVCKPRIALADAAGDRNKQWRYAIAREAKSAMLKAGITEPLRGALKVQFVFMVPRPRMHFNGKGHILSRFIHAQPVHRPDALKLARAAEDALTKILWVDDSQNVDVRSVKIYGENPGVIIKVSYVTAPEPPEPDALPF